MIAFKNYLVTENLHESLGGGAYRGVRRRDEATVIIRTLQNESPSSRNVERLHHQYVISRQLESPYVIRPEELDTRESQPLLIYPDFSGQSLAQMTGTPFETGCFIEIAVQLSIALADIHRQGIVHRDIKPANILIPARDGLEIKLTGFGIAAPPVHHTVASDEGLIEGSPPYMSPEQTGRMNRGVDQRSDLYSLGVTLYKMLTGTSPFQAADLPEWVHCHIAREPKPPRELVSTIPGPLAAIVMKLLAKPAEARYQSARELFWNLQCCREQWSFRGQIEEFSLGEKDVSPLFLVPDKLYGRSEHLAMLTSAFERVAASGRPELMLVCGYSGIGKSSLVQALSQPIIRRRGYFISGKFEEHRQDIPYASIAQALRGLIRQIMSALSTGEKSCAGPWGPAAGLS